MLSSQTLALALVLVQLLDGRLAIQTADLPSSGICYPLAFSVHLCCSLWPLLSSMRQYFLVVLILVAFHSVGLLKSPRGGVNR